MTADFNFKKLLVWQKAMDFAVKCLEITESLDGHYRLRYPVNYSSPSRDVSHA